MHQRNRDDLSRRIARLAPADPGPAVRDRVLAAMAAAVAETVGSRTSIGRERALFAQAPGLAAAAGVAAVAMLSVLLAVEAGIGTSGREATALSDPAAAGPGRGTAVSAATPPALMRAGTAASAADTAAVTASGTTALAALIEVSWMLEQALEQLPAQRRLMRVGTASTIAALETRIALIDEQLAPETDAGQTTEQLAALWRDRVEVMSALYQVRYGQSQLFGY